MKEELYNNIDSVHTKVENLCTDIYVLNDVAIKRDVAKKIMSILCDINGVLAEILDDNQEHKED